MTVTSPAIGPATPERLKRLRSTALAIAEPRRLVRIGGVVAEIRPTSLTVRGLSQVAKLGDLVSRSEERRVGKECRL